LGYVSVAESSGEWVVMRSLCFFSVKKLDSLQRAAAGIAPCRHAAISDIVHTSVLLLSFANLRGSSKFLITTSTTSNISRLAAATMLVKSVGLSGCRFPTSSCTYTAEKGLQQRCPEVKGVDRP